MDGPMQAGQIATDGCSIRGEIGIVIDVVKIMRDNYDYASPCLTSCTLAYS